MLIDPIFIKIFSSIGFDGKIAKIVGAILGLWAIVVCCIIELIDLNKWTNPDESIIPYREPRQLKIVLIIFVVSQQVIQKMGSVLDVIAAEKAEEEHQKEKEEHQREREETKTYREKLLSEIQELKAVSGGEHAQLAIDNLYTQFRNSMKADMHAAIDSSFDSKIGEYDVSLRYDAYEYGRQHDMR
jgi:hypothetical protein